MTEKQTHTPAPWRYNKQNDFVTAYTNPKEPVVCSIARIPEYEANARLIAAAPDLLDALEDLLEHCNLSLKESYFYADGNKRNVNEFRANAKAAIAKARGE